jgi:UDP:flavonoid glycosyltransferase YjiC (YdhE family)
MKLLVLAFGSRGDVQPILPLGAGLREAGYEVQIAAGTNFKAGSKAGASRSSM